jgi:hypothetical protein
MDWFLAVVGEVAPWWRDGPFLWQLDCENFGYNGGAPSKGTISAACDYLHAKTGMAPFVYAPRWEYGDSMTGLGYPLWASNYGINAPGLFVDLYPGDDSDRWAAYSGQTPAVLQYGSRAMIGTQSTCDANAFRGSLADLVALTGGRPMETGDTDMLMIKPSPAHDDIYLLNGTTVSHVLGYATTPGEATQFDVLTKAGIPYKELGGDDSVWQWFANRDTTTHPPAAPPVTLTDADRSAIATQVAALIGSLAHTMSDADKTSIAADIAQRIANG